MITIYLFYRTSFFRITPADIRYVGNRVEYFVYGVVMRESVCLSL